jgi:formylglycine-generating enzyme required for sulfatase activity
MSAVVAQGTNNVAVPGGSFTMGTSESRVDALMARFSSKRRELFASELPAHAVSVRAFFMDRTEVTNAAFKMFVDVHPEWSRERLTADRHNGEDLKTWVGGSYPAGESDLPVTFITWHAATAYRESAGKRLPTEASGSLLQEGDSPQSSHGVKTRRMPRTRTGRARRSGSRRRSAVFRRRTDSTTWQAMSGSSRRTPGKTVISTRPKHLWAGASSAAAASAVLP